MKLGAKAAPVPRPTRLSQASVRPPEDPKRSEFISTAMATCAYGIPNPAGWSKARWTELGLGEDRMKIKTAVREAVGRLYDLHMEGFRRYRAAHP
jgi:hypothetical protein